MLKPRPKKKIPAQCGIIFVKISRYRERERSEVWAKR